jgi:hypothetical protein
VPPSISIIDIYDAALVPESDRANDTCLSRVTDKAQQTVVVLEGSNFGARMSSFSARLVSLTAPGVVDCVPCYITHTTARCITTASRTATFNLSLTVAQQSSAAVLYDYTDLIKVPSIANVQPLWAPTRGGALLTISGTNFKDRGLVTLVKGSLVLNCTTPPPGQEGDVNGVYYAKDGKSIQVRGVTSCSSGLFCACVFTLPAFLALST